MQPGRFATGVAGTDRTGTNADRPRRKSVARTRFLLLEDDARLARAIALHLRPYCEIVIAGAVGEGLRALEERSVRWFGFIVDLGLPDGSGLDVLRRARKTHPSTPALVFTGSIESEYINAAFRVGARYLVKDETNGVDGDELVRFVLGALPLSNRLETGALDWGTRYGLTMAEVDLLIGAALGEDRETLAMRRNSSLGTVKVQIGSLLRKTGDRSVLEAATRLLREVQL
jgi:DNA-binding NarL/FixJ family response regulator